MLVFNLCPAAHIKRCSAPDGEDHIVGLAARRMVFVGFTISRLEVPNTPVDIRTEMFCEAHSESADPPGSSDD